jgi:diguanylate cyclase (GGDEF)-like protein
MKNTNETQKEMTPGNREGHEHDHDVLMKVTNPQRFAIELMAGKNSWLTRMRWIYTFFILVFFVFYNYVSETPLIPYRTLALILGLSVLGNILFFLVLKRALKYPSEKYDFEIYASLAALQLDFDLVILFLLAFFSTGFDSPVMLLFVFYVMVATFLTDRKKAFRNTVTAIILVVVIFFASAGDNDGLIVSVERLTTLIGFTIILLFAFFISAYLSQNLKEKEEKLQDLLQKTRELSVTDGLTNLYNQTHFFLLLKLQLEKSRRYRTAFSLILFDVDHFKNYNDKNGHLKGSETLRRIAGLMRKVFRSSDVLAKYGGDEFVVILPHSDKVGAFLAADRLREVIEAEPFEGAALQPLGKVTLSLGITSYPEHGQKVEDLLDRADKALYFAKNTGRNKTVIYNKNLEEK